MPIFHDEEDDDAPFEPIEGLPQNLPEGEAILWQGSPDGAGLAVHALHVRFVAAYFAATALWRGFNAATPADGAVAAGAVLLAGAVVIGVLYLIARAMARASIFTITTRRVVFRYGVAIRKYINIPFADIGGVGLKLRGETAGDIALTPACAHKAPYFHLWPFARPLRIRRPVPLLRALPDAKTAADVLANAMKTFAPANVALAETKPAGEPPLATTGGATTSGATRPGALAPGAAA